MESEHIAVVMGTRPEVVKLAGIVRAFGSAARVVHTGQHYTPELAAFFLDELGLDEPKVQLEVGGGTRGEQIGEVVRLLDQELASHRTTAVVVQGDTNTAVAGGLAANARGLPLVHVEAGLRSFDRAMPEEHNRVVLDHLADLCCAPTAVSREHLLREGIPDERIAVTGNTVVDAVYALLPDADHRAALLRNYGVEGSRFVLATLHRPENVDDAEQLATILHELGGLGVPVLFPLHPRTVARIRAFGLAELLDPLMVVPPASYRAFLALARECALLVSDSGGVQEEASVLKRPVVVVRRSTERPEVLGTFSRLVAPGSIRDATRDWLADPVEIHAHLSALPCPYGDGSAGAKTVRLVAERFGQFAMKR